MGSIKRLARAFWLPVLLAALLPDIAQAAPDVAQRNSPAAAPTGSESRSIRIAYHDLDLATPEGIAALYVRIHRAADELCGANHVPTGTRLVPPRAEACVRSAVAATVKQIGVPGLAALELQQQVLRDAATDARPQCDRPQRARIII